jgi:hypothetical protein
VLGPGDDYEADHMPLYELELRRNGLSDEERLYCGEPFDLQTRVAIQDSVWRVIEISVSVRPDAHGRVLLLWEGWRRNEVARLRAIALVEEAAALQAQSRLILKRVRANQERRQSV